MFKKIMSSNLKNYEKFMYAHYNNETKKIVNK